MNGEKKKENKLKKLINSRTFHVTLLLFVIVVIVLFMLIGSAVILFSTYTITLDLGDESEPMVETYNINSGAIDLGIPTREGFRFVGWTGSNGDKPSRNVTVGNGRLGNLSFTANWSDQLNVTCQDWIVDAKGTPVQEITSDIDKFLKDGKSTKNYKAQERTVQVKNGDKINPSRWGDDKAYKVYHSDYMYVGNSGEITVTEDEMVVYRYFYPVLDVNYRLDGVSPSENEIADGDVGRFDLYVDDKLVTAEAWDFCGGVPFGSKYEVVPKNTNPAYKYDEEAELSGVMGSTRNNVDISFATRQGEYTVRCEDWVIDEKGDRKLEITDKIDSYLSAGKSGRKYPVVNRELAASKGDVVSAADWGCDPSYNAYSEDFMYVSCSDEITVNRDNMTVYRYFYPVLDIAADVNGNQADNTKGLGRFNLYVNGKLEAEDVYDFRQGIPAQARYRVEMSGYDDWSCEYKPSVADELTMGSYARTMRLKFVPREGDSYVTIEDWLVDAHDNRIRQITDETDAYLTAGKSSKGYTLQPRIIRAQSGDVLDPALFGNDEERKSYSDVYDYVGASGETTVEGNNTVLYRYFYPVLDVNGLIDGNLKGNLGDVATFSVYVDGRRVDSDLNDFCDGVPCGSKYEIRDIEVADGYEYVDEGVTAGVMGDEVTSMQLTINSIGE
ncbi:hypothetical protein [Butyrivibrio sp. FCS006]|uniref:hypothetical protein n=1 Tax=Butyrivibrio sp. FCS006 TaxID=1280684 RepID=UPI000402DB95|nr:hypothetical protein [Butyrivibrio sp. FCS006]